MTGAVVTASGSTNILDAGSSNDLVAEYRFDTGAGDTAYDTAGNNDGTINGASWTEGVEEKALSFDGSSRIGISHEDSFQPVNSFTASVWMKPDTVPSSGSIGVIGNSDYQNGGFTLGLRGGDYVASLNDGSSEYLAYGPEADEEWAHLLISFDGSTAKLYLNGDRVASRSADMTRNSNSFQIGSTTQGGWDNFNGNVDEVKIYSENLSKSQIRSLYNSGSWRIGSEDDSIAFSQSEGFETYLDGNSIDGKKGWTYGGSCSDSGCTVTDVRSEDGGKSLNQSDGGGDLYADSLTYTFEEPLNGEIVVEGEYWEKSSPNWDGNFWVKDCSGSGIAGIGTENPQFEADINNSQAYGSNPGAGYQEWTHVKMELDTSTGEVNFNWTQDNSGATDTYTGNFGAGRQICEFGVGPGGEWFIDDISIRQKKAKVLDMSFQHKNSTHVYDTSGNENHGQPQNGASQEGAVNCKVGRCYSFDGSNDRVETSLHPKDIAIEDNQPKTIMAWTKVNSFDGGGIWEVGLTEDDKEFSMKTRSSQDSFRAQLWSSGDIDFSCDASGKWAHITLTHNGSLTEVYCNGLKANQQWQTVNTTKGEPFTVGEWSGSVLEGKVDQVKILNRSLSQQEIIEEAEGLSSKGAVLDMRFDENGGDHVEDHSINDDHGSLQPNETSGPSWTEGIEGRALSFDGSDDSVLLNSENNLALDSTEGFVLSSWVKRDPISGRDEMIMAHIGTDRIRFEIREGGDVGMVYYSNSDDDWTSSWVLGTSVDDGQWHKVDWKVKEDVLSVYVDGKKRGETSLTYSLPNVDGSVELGPGTGSAEHYSGKLDNLKLHNYPLKPEKIKESFRKPLMDTVSNSLQNDLVLYQTFDRVETCGQSDTVSCPSGMSGEVAADESGEANHGELVNGPTEKGAKDCGVGGCLDFDGNDDYVNVKDSPTLNPGSNSFSFFAWAKVSGNSDNRATVNDKYSGGDNGAYQLNIQPTGELHLDIGDGSNDYDVETSGYSLMDNSWHLVGFVVNRTSNSTQLFVDGEQAEKSATGLSGEIKYGQDLQIGGQGSVESLEGRLDGLKLYNRSLSNDEVWKLYTRGRDRSSSGEMAGAVARYRFDAGPRVCILNQGSLSDGGWGGPSDSELKNALEGEGWNTLYVQVGDITEDGWKSCEVIVFPNSEGYPAFDKSADFCSNVNGEGGENDVFMEMKEFMNDGGLWVGTWGAGLWYGKAWDGSSWTDYTSCSQYSGDNLYKDGGQDRCSNIGYSCYSGGTYDYSNINQEASPAVSGTVTSASRNYRWASNLDVNVAQAYNSTSGNSISSKYIGIESVGEGYYLHPGGSYLFDPGNHGSAEEMWNNLLTWYAGNGGQNFWDSAGSNKGTISGDGNAPVYTLGKNGKAMEFDGSDDKVRVQDSSLLDVTDGITYSMWLKPEDARSLTHGKPGAYMFWQYGSEEIQFGVYNSGSYSGHLSGKGKLPKNEWTHVAGTYDKNRVKLYINGELATQSGSTSGTIDTTNNDFFIGYGGGWSDGYFNGTIDDVRLYPYALTQEQVKQVMNKGAVSAG